MTLMDFKGVCASFVLICKTLLNIIRRNLSQKRCGRCSRLSVYRESPSRSIG